MTEKDGFDLIEYPCDFEFKAMVRASNFANKDELEMWCVELLETAYENKKVKNARSSVSRTGKFYSVTLALKLMNRAELELGYQALAAGEHVVMTL